VDYKIIAKILAMRIKKVMNSIIDEEQTGFVPERDIRINVAMARAYLEKINKYEEEGGELLLDFEKAFDRVDRVFMEMCLMQLGMGANYISMVMLLHSDTSARVITRNGVSGEIDVKSGVRQGCPLAPYLYVISMLPLLLGLKKHEPIVVSEVNIWAAMFADDTTAYYKDEADARAKIDTIKDYGRASAAKLNLDKTECVGIKPPGDLIRPANFFGRGQYTILLGAPISVDGNIGDYWKRKVEDAIFALKA